MPGMMAAQHPTDPSPARPAGARGTRICLLALLWFNGVTAVAGGIGLVTGLMPTDPTLLEGSPFPGYEVPGAFLMLVGGLHVAAASLVHRRHPKAWRLAGAAGAAMIGFELVEYAVIGYHWLQVVYLVSGAAIGLLALALRR